MLKFLEESAKNYDVGAFLNELVDASKLLGAFDAKVIDSRFASPLLPMLHRKEAVASMAIEGTQTTITDLLENEIETHAENNALIEGRIHLNALIRCENILLSDDFSNELIQNLHLWMMDGVLGRKKDVVLGKYKTRDNRIVNSARNVVYEPPAHTETKRYMDELVAYMNAPTDSAGALIRAAVAHAQFESIHPFEDGNGRVGRALVSLHLCKEKVISHPYFYLSEAINREKSVYYSKLDSSRTGNFTEWIAFFLRKVAYQAQRNIEYVDALNILRERTRETVKSVVNSQKFDGIMKILFRHPVISSKVFCEQLGISNLQANRYLASLQKVGILHGNDKKRNRIYYFLDLLDLMQR